MENINITIDEHNLGPNYITEKECNVFNSL